MNFLREGCLTVEEIAQKLAEAYAGLPAIKVNAPSSASVHWHYLSPPIPLGTSDQGAGLATPAKKLDVSVSPS